MFTGIVQSLGIIAGRHQRKNGIRLAVKTTINLKRVMPGSSVAVNGACLTAVEKMSDEVWFDVVPETMRRTTLGRLKRGDSVNLEPSLLLGDEIGGHFVLGHIDGIGVITSLSHRGKEVLMVVGVPKKLMQNIAEKGSVAVDGVSLTVARVRGNSFNVALVPYTLQHTTLGKLKKGDRVNIEVDMVARYLEKLTSNS